MTLHSPGRRYAWIVVGVTFLSLLAAAGLRSAPGVMMTPLQAAFGWDRATVSAAAAFGIFLYGMVGPFAAALMQTLGIRRTLLGGLTLMAVATGLSLFMTEPWHYVLTWGLLSGLGSGAVALVLGATVANRWFDRHRGLVMGIFSASTATGSLLFLPVLAWLSENGGWRPVAMAVTIVTAAMVPIVALLLPERPSDVGLLPYGATGPRAEEPGGKPGESVALALRVLAKAAGTPVFWLLFGTFFVCGLTTNGLVGTHLIAYCGDNGIGAVQASGLLAAMGLFDLLGTTASGWLTDRYDPRKLLFIYYGIRGLSLVALPFTGFDIVALSVFAVFYGLDWIATVPPTVKLAGLHFGDRDAPIVFGWVAAGHQAGAATAALGAGLLRDATGSYTTAFIVAGAIGVLAAFGALAIARDAARHPVEPTPA